MPISTAKRRFYALVGCVTGWGILFLLVGFPIFHLHFKVPIATIVSYAGICCVIQMALVEWLIYAKMTARSPEAWFLHRTIAVTVFMTMVSLLFFYYLRRGRPDPDTREFTSIAMGGTLLFAVLWPIKSILSRRMRNG